MINYATLGSLITPAKVIRCGKGSFPVLSMTMHNGIVMQSERFKKSLASTDQSDYKVVKRGQLVVGFPIDEGVLYVQKAADEGIMSPAYNVWDIDSEMIDPDFLELCLHSPQSMQYYKNKLRGTTARRRSIPVSDLQALEIRLPDMQTQREIVAIMKKAEAIFAHRREQLDYYEQLVKSRFIELFGDQTANPYGWQQTSIGACCTLKSGTSLPADKENEGGAIPYVKVGDMNYPGNEQYITTSSRFVSEQTAGTGVFPVGTVVFPKRGGAIGTNKKRLTRLPICADLNVMGVTAGRRLTPQYLMAYFNTVDLGTLNNGSSVPQINNKDIAPLLICIPPMALQEQFAAFVEQTDKSKLAVQKGLQELEILKKSLMQQYFG